MPQVDVNDPDDPPFVYLSRTAMHSILVAAVRLAQTPYSEEPAGPGRHDAGNQPRPASAALGGVKFG